MPAETPITRWLCYYSNCCVLGQSSGRATEHILHCCCRATYELQKNTFFNWYYCTTCQLLLLLHQQKIYLAAVQKTVNSSAWNQFFNFQRRGPPRRRARKLLSLCHTHGSALRNPYLPCQIIVQRKSSEVEQKLRNILQEKLFQK